MAWLHPRIFLCVMHVCNDKLLVHTSCCYSQLFLECLLDDREDRRCHGKANIQDYNQPKKLESDVIDVR